MIKIDDIGDGDQVVIQDQMKNVARGLVRTWTGKDQQQARMIDIFGTPVAFATRRDAMHQWKAVKEARVVGHTPLMFGGEHT